MSLLARLSRLFSPRRDAAAVPTPVTVQPEAPPHVPAAPPIPPDRVVQPWWSGGVPDEALALSKVLEGLKLEPYDDNGEKSGGTWTIGYGSTRDAAGRPVTANTPPITLPEAEALKRRDLAKAEALARAACPGGLPARWEAVVILCCNNMGDIRMWGPTLHSLLLTRQWNAAAAQLRHYRNQRDGAGVLRPELGLRRRRWCEAAYACGMDAQQAYQTAWTQIRTVDDWPPLPG